MTIETSIRSRAQRRGASHCCGCDRRQCRRTRRFSVLAAARGLLAGPGTAGLHPAPPGRRAARFRPALCHIYMATIVAPGVARLRFAGRDVAGIFGMEVRGMPMSVRFSTPGSRVRDHDAIDRAVRGPAIVELPLEMQRGGFSPAAVRTDEPFAAARRGRRGDPPAGRDGLRRPGSRRRPPRPGLGNADDAVRSGSSVWCPRRNAGPGRPEPQVPAPGRGAAPRGGQCLTVALQSSAS